MYYRNDYNSPHEPWEQPIETTGHVVEEPGHKEPKKKKSFGGKIVALCLVCALVGGACFLGGRWSAGRSETAKIDTVVLQNQLSEIRELATVTYAYTNMAQFESSNDFYGVKIPFTTKSFILTYDGTVKAGVDLDGAEVSVSGTTVTITLPEAEILSHEIDEDSMEVFDEKTSIFNPFTVEDFTSSYNRFTVWMQWETA